FILGIFAPPFRRPSIWWKHLVLFVGPYALSVWLNDSGVIAFNPMLLMTLILLIAAVWFAAIGYQLQRGSYEGQSHGDAGSLWSRITSQLISRIGARVMEKRSSKLGTEQTPS